MLLCLNQPHYYFPVILHQPTVKLRSLCGVCVSVFINIIHVKKALLLCTYTTRVCTIGVPLNHIRASVHQVGWFPSTYVDVEDWPVIVIWLNSEVFHLDEGQCCSATRDSLWQKAMTKWWSDPSKTNSITMILSAACWQTHSEQMSGPGFLPCIIVQWETTCTGPNWNILESNPSCLQSWR